MDAVADRFIEEATRGLRFLLLALAPTPGEAFLERVMGAHCNGSGHVPGCPNGDGVPVQFTPDTRRPDTREEEERLDKYKHERMKQAQAEAKAVVPEDVHTPIPGIPDAKIYGSDIEEMLDMKAVRASLRNGVSPEVHEEAVLRTAEILPSGHVTETRPGGKKTKTKINKNGKDVVVPDPIENKHLVETKFKAKDGERYTAVYTIHQYRQKGMKPKVYFMYCKK